MKIGELANLVGIAPSTIRYYEQVGLIDPLTRVSGQRRFATNDVQILRFIQLAQAGGFTIAEIKTIFDGYPDTEVSNQWHTLAKNKKLENEHWLKTGQTELANRMRRAGSLQALTERVLGR